MSYWGLCVKRAIFGASSRILKRHRFSATIITLLQICTCICTCTLHVATTNAGRIDLSRPLCQFESEKLGDFGVTVQKKIREVSMTVYVVAYDLNNPGQDYAAMKSAIEKYPHCYIQDSVYAVKTSLSATQLRDALLAVVDKNDSILVTKLTGYAWSIKKSIAECLGELLK